MYRVFQKFLHPQSFKVRGKCIDRECQKFLPPPEDLKEGKGLLAHPVSLQKSYLWQQLLSKLSLMGKTTMFQISGGEKTNKI
jgi:hypothetical protein